MQQQHDRSSQTQNQRSRISIFGQKPKTKNTVTESSCSFGQTSKKPKIQQSLPYKSEKQKAKNIKYHAVIIAKNQKSKKSKEPAHINEKTKKTKIQRSL